MVFQMLMCDECYEDGLRLKAYILSSRCWTMDSLYAFRCKRFRNTRQAVTFELPFGLTWIGIESHIEP
jgi:hypothetical protein